METPDIIRFFCVLRIYVANVIAYPIVTVMRCTNIGRSRAPKVSSISPNIKIVRRLRRKNNVHGIVSKVICLVCLFDYTAFAISGKVGIP